MLTAVRTTNRRIRMVAALTITALAAMAPGLSAPALAGPSTTTQDWTGHAACTGGGRLTFAVSLPSTGQVTLTATTHGLPEDTHWRSVLEQDPQGGTGDSKTIRSTVADGGFTVTTAFDPISHAMYSVNTAGPHGATCIFFISDAKTTGALATCANGRYGGLLVASRPDPSTVVRVAISPVKPHSTWSIGASLTSGSTGIGVGESKHADADGTVKGRFAFPASAWNEASATFTSPAGRTCTVALASQTTT